MLDNALDLSVAEAPIDIGQAEHAGFRALYEAEFAFVWRSLSRLGALPSDLEDIAHDVFLVAWRRMSEYDTTRPVRPWLFGIAVRVLANHRRASGRRREVPLLLDYAPHEPRARDGAGRVEARDLVLRALHAMDLEQRAVLCLHDIEGATMPEVAAALSIPLNTGYSRLRLARARFAREVERVRGHATNRPNGQAKESTDEHG
jgi:RNA polymerase sigma-70 factor (ECF subfamily)